MKPTLQLLIIALFANIFVSCAQKITSFKVQSVDNANIIKPYKKVDESDKGERKIKLSIELSANPKKDINFNLTILPNNISSAPALSSPTIIIKKNDIKLKKLETVFTLNLKPLDCLVNDEKFEIKIINFKYAKGAVNDSIIIITHIDPPNPVQISLIDELTTVKPYLKSNKDDNGQRTIVLNLILSGKRNDARNVSLKYLMPSFIKSPSNPKLLNDFKITIKKDSFNIDGCPKKIKVPVVIQLSAVDDFKEEEKIPILISKDGTADDKHAHILNIRQEVKKTEETKPKPIDTTKYSFSHACVNGKIFKVKLETDSIGGFIKVLEEKENKEHKYHYNNFYHSADFAKWIINSFNLKINLRECNECAACVSYLAERVQEEIDAFKKQKIQESLATIKSSTADIVKKEDSLAKAISAKAPSDTLIFNDNISYNLTNLLGLSITKLKTKTEVEICRDPKNGTDSCNKNAVAGQLTKGEFNSLINLSLKKIMGDETFDSTKISPTTEDLYNKYVKFVASKQVKVKSEFEKILEKRIEELENEVTTYTKVGNIFLKDSVINIYNEFGDILKRTKIDSVTFSIEAGKLVRRLIYVETQDGTFFNKNAPVSVNRINERGRDPLVKLGVHNDKSYILLGDVLKYKSDGGYVPDDSTGLVLTPEKRVKELSATSNLNSLINFSIYTDLAGLLGRRANGIVNTDISGKFITNTSNILKRDITPTAFIEGNFVLSKFDSKFKSMDSTTIKADTITHKDIVDRMQLIQTAWFKGSMKFNLFSIRFLHNQYLYANFGFRINVVNADSFYKKERDILMFDYYPELVYSINRLKNFGMDISLRWIWQKLADKEQFENKSWEFIFNPQIAFNYYPTGNQNNKIYLRFNYFANRNKDANNFYQLQFGIKTGFKSSK